MKEMREELEKVYQEQAQAFIHQQIAEKEAQLKAQFEEAVQIRAQTNSATKGDTEMSYEQAYKKQGSLIPRMGTRKNPTEFGRDRGNIITTAQSNDDSLGQAMSDQTRMV